MRRLAKQYIMSHIMAVQLGNHFTINPGSWSLRLEPRNHDVCVAYASCHYTTQQIAASFGITRRQVQRIVKQGGVGRSQAEGNRVAAPLKPRHRVRRVR